MLDGDFDHGAEVVVVLAADGDVAGIDAVLGERLGAGGILGSSLVAVVVEVADDGRVDAALGRPSTMCGNGGGGVVVVDRDADELGAGAREGLRPARWWTRRRRCRCWSSTARRPELPTQREPNRF
jgi:hypothetical protein